MSSNPRNQGEMILILSKNSLDSIQSIEKNIDFDDNLMFHQDNHVSFDILQNEEPPQPPKAIPITTQDHVQTPSKKKKTGCVCKKTGCLKLYCDCFSSGKLCTEECSCINCGNLAENKEEIANARCLRKNRLQGGEKKCNCKKSTCQKKYCECFNAGRPCTPQCNCVGCHNPENEKHEMKTGHKKKGI